MVMTKTAMLIILRTSSVAMVRRFRDVTYTPSKTMKSTSLCIIGLRHPPAISAIRYTQRVNTVRNARRKPAAKSLKPALLLTLSAPSLRGFLDRDSRTQYAAAMPPNANKVTT